MNRYINNILKLYITRFNNIHVTDYKKYSTCYILCSNFKNINFKKYKNKITIGCEKLLKYIIYNNINFLPTIICIANPLFLNKFFTTYYKQFTKLIIKNKILPTIIIHPTPHIFSNKRLLQNFTKIYNKFTQIYSIKNFVSNVLCNSLNIGLKNYIQNHKYCSKYRHTIPMIAMYIAQLLNFTNIILVNYYSKINEYEKKISELIKNNINIIIKNNNLKTPTNLSNIILSNIILPIPKKNWSENNIIYLLNNYMLQMPKKIKQLNNKRCFILGNGPSLKNVNFTLLKNEVTIACNFFMKGAHEQKINFIPTILCMGDKYCCQQLLDNDYKYIIKKNKKQPIIIIHPTSSKIINEPDKKYIDIYNKFNNIYSIKCFDKFLLTKKLNIGNKQILINYHSYCMLYSNIIPMISMLIAEKLGFNEIYLLGVDFDNFINHFYKYSSHRIKKTKVYSQKGYKNAIMGFIKRKKEYQKKKIKVINCNMYSKLNIFPKVPLYTILKNR